VRASTCIDEVNGDKHREGKRLSLFGAVSVDMRSAGPMVVRREVQGNLNIAHPALERQRGHEFLSHLQCARLEEGSI
jgi:hypothetical protein